MVLEVNNPLFLSTVLAEWLFETAKEVVIHEVQTESVHPKSKISIEMSTVPIIIHRFHS
jgi:hypothetical protein